MSLSGLVQLPPKDGREIKLPSDDEDESDLVDIAEDGLSIAQELDFQSGSSAFVCAKGVLGRDWWWLIGSWRRSLGEDCILHCCQAGRVGSIFRGTSTDGMGISEAKRIVGSALLWLEKLLILGRRIR